MLINPEVDAKNDIAWICDGCGKMMNIQPGFREDYGEWICTECGFVNKIDPYFLSGTAKQDGCMSGRSLEYMSRRYLLS